MCLEEGEGGAEIDDIMKDSSYRLHLVVRRHSLPEVRIIHHVSLENDPTISDLVEQINDLIPLESPEWGLKDYVVELRNKDGFTFECLHFEPSRCCVARGCKADQGVQHPRLYVRDVWMVSSRWSLFSQIFQVFQFC